MIAHAVCAGVMSHRARMAHAQRWPPVAGRSVVAKPQPSLVIFLWDWQHTPKKKHHPETGNFDAPQQYLHLIVKNRFQIKHQFVTSPTTFAGRSLIVFPFVVNKYLLFTRILVETLFMHLWRLI
ncbi:hypothetical protein [Comamonas sp. JNW]|uniref:hypothetical protein n=1 Tax=unclassified Comamonas TaxID=2638500 RepID=UPI0010583335|nr:hypothetical protein [Comamonas sp. JNW]